MGEDQGGDVEGGWNHRIVREKYPNSEGYFYGICEVYYKCGHRDADLWSRPVAVDTDAATDDEARASLRETLERMLKALDGPVMEGKEWSAGRGWAIENKGGQLIVEGSPIAEGEIAYAQEVGT